MSTVVVGYKPTPQGEAALRAAIEEAQRAGARLVVVNAPPGGGRSGGGTVVVGEARQRLDGVLAASGVGHEVRQPQRGLDPAEEIGDAVEETGAELVVIGMRSRTPIGKLVMGSNAQQVLLEVAAPVLTVRAQYDG